MKTREDKRTAIFEKMNEVSSLKDITGSIKKMEGHRDIY